MSRVRNKGGVDRLCTVEGITCYDSMSRVRNKGGVDRLCTVEGITCYDSMSRVRNKEVNQRQVKLISGKKDLK